MAVPTCICGAPAPETLPEPGGDPVPCAACATPLVRPGPVRRSAVERAVGASAIAAVLAAGTWLGASWWTRGGAPWAVPLAGLGAGAAVRFVGGARGRVMQWIAVASAVLSAALGEILLYRHTTYVRLVALHEEEGRTDAAFLAEEEFRSMDPWRYLHIEATPWLFLALAASVWLAWRLAARPPAVVTGTDEMRRPALRTKNPSSGE